jgi:hypothetical protein
MQNDEKNKTKGNSIYPSIRPDSTPHYQREATYKGKDGDSFTQTGAVILAIVVGGIGLIILALHYLG